MEENSEVNIRKFVDWGAGRYTLPKYRVDNGLHKTKDNIPIKFASTDQDGIITESLLSMLIKHLNDLNVGDLRNRHTSLAITHLEDARMRLEERKRDRQERGVYGTKEA